MPEETDISRYSFPHLDDTQFPLLDNVDVYKYENEFDYGRWSDDTKIHLCNVLWNSDYSNVVKFADNDARDKWFDSLDGYAVELRSAFNIAPDGSVKVPIPYQVATRYNYMYVDLPIMTSEEEPINYENPRRTKRYYYFIDGLVQGSPSSTMLIVKPDNWTTYINNVEIPYMMLERGHAPMAAVKADDYLDNPLAGNRYLLAPDFDFSRGEGQVKSARFLPINNGTKYILFATTMSYSQMQSMPYPTAAAVDNQNPVYSDYSSRNGYQYQVEHWEYNQGGYDYNGMVTQTANFQSANDAIPNGTVMVAVAASGASALFSYMADRVPYVYKTIKAMFMVDDTMFTRGASFTFCNATCYRVSPAADSVLSAISLAKSDFGYDEKYREIAKLYTSPYAEIEVTDNNGNSKRFKIENTGSLQVRKATALAFPYISIQAYITGINGSGSTSYTWKKISGATDTKSMFSDDFGEYLWKFDIPTYALYVRGYDEYKANNYAQQYANGLMALHDYHNTVRAVNCTRENAVDSADNTRTMTDNTAASENTNAVNMANTIKTNNTSSANTARTNHRRSANTAQTNSNNQAANLVANTARDIKKNNSATITQGNSQATQISYSNLLLYALQRWDAGLTNAVTNAENQQTMINGVANAVGAIGNARANAASAMGSLNVLGAVGASEAAGAEIIASGVSMYAAVTKNDTVANATNNTAYNKMVEVQDNNVDMNQLAYKLQQDITSINNVAAKDITENTSNTIKTNAENTANSERSNADATRTTSVDNASRTNTTSVNNANRTKANANKNSKLARDVSVANATYTRDALVNNAQNTLDVKKRINAIGQYNQAKLNPPQQFGDYTGDATLDAFERCGLQIKVRTQSAGNIAQAGDLMLRYGYALNQVWNVSESGLLAMRNFTYWKAADIWINEGEGVNQGAQSDIQRAFENGVTVWADPTKIGKVSIYDNWK